MGKTRALSLPLQRESPLGRAPVNSELDSVPAYLSTYYWWTYIHPFAITFSNASRS
jgi:hypothetical protein